jgi:hypothetical protein
LKDRARKNYIIDITTDLDGGNDDDDGVVLHDEKMSEPTRCERTTVVKTQGAEAKLGHNL